VEQDLNKEILNWEAVVEDEMFVVSQELLSIISDMVI
jgi:hypothetical protein